MWQQMIRGGGSLWFMQFTNRVLINSLFLSVTLTSDPVFFLPFVPVPRAFSAGFSVTVVSAACQRLWGRLCLSFSRCLACKFWCAVLQGKSVCFYLHISAWRITYPLGVPLPSPFLFLLIERGSMRRGSRLFGQSTLLTAWRQMLHIQPCSIVKNSFLWNSCCTIFLDELVILLMSAVLHWVAGASFTSEALHFQSCRCW